MSIIIPRGSIIASFIYEKSSNLEGYEEMDRLTLKEVSNNNGYLGHEVFTRDKKNIFISYWKDFESLEIWKKNSLHIKAKKMGETWYKSYKIQISKLHNNYILD